jgi:hypothetical protein
MHNEIALGFLISAAQHYCLAKAPPRVKHSPFEALHHYRWMSHIFYTVVHERLILVVLDINVPPSGSPCLR